MGQPNPGLFFIYFRIFKHITNFYNKYVCEKMSIQYTVQGIRTHNLCNMSLLPPSGNLSVDDGNLAMGLYHGLHKASITVSTRPPSRPEA